MASDIERMLEINSRIESGNKSVPLNKAHKAPNQQVLDKLVENIDKQVYGPVAQPILKEGEQKPYDPREEMKMLKEIEANGGRKAVNLEGRNIPRGIVESILNNPLDMPIDNSDMDDLENRLMGNMPGIKAAANILERVDKQDKEARAKINENIIPKQNTTSNIDYDLLKTIIESCIDNKINDLKQALNESVSHQSYVPSMKMMNFKDNFYFVDNDDNVFECVMKYKGKRKKKQ